MGGPWRIDAFVDTAKEDAIKQKLEPPESETIILTRDEVRADVFDYIERFYNQQRRHSTLDFISPVQFEQGLMG